MAKVSKSCLAKGVKVEWPFHLLPPFRSGGRKGSLFTTAVRACRCLHQTLRGLTRTQGRSLCWIRASALTGRTLHGSNDGTAGGLSAPCRPDEASDDIQGLRQGCPAACRSVLQRWNGQVAGIW